MSQHWVTQNLKENRLVAWKMTWGIWLAFIWAVESLKVCTLVGSLCPKHPNFLSKKYKRVIFITLKSDAKFEEKLSLSFKSDMRNLGNFNASSSKSKNLHFNVMVSSKVCYLWAKKVQMTYMSQNWRTMQNLTTNWLVLWKMKWVIGEFWLNTRKSQN